MNMGRIGIFVLGLLALFLLLSTACGKLSFDKMSGTYYDSHCRANVIVNSEDEVIVKFKFLDDKRKPNTQYAFLITRNYNNVMKLSPNSKNVKGKASIVFTKDKKYVLRVNLYAEKDDIDFEGSKEE